MKENNDWPQAIELIKLYVTVEEYGTHQKHLGFTYLNGSIHRQFLVGLVIWIFCLRMDLVRTL